MLLSCVLAAVVLLVPHPLPDDRTVDFDPQLDFSQFKTFALGQSRLRSPKPELNNDIIRKKIQDALRGELTRRGLMEEAIQSSDLVLVVTTNSYSKGTLVVDVIKRDVEKLFEKYASTTR